MALALEDFEALCGFVAPAELKEKLRNHEELKACVGAAADAFLEADEADIKPVSADPGAASSISWLPAILV